MRRFLALVAVSATTTGIVLLNSAVAALAEGHAGCC
jgi:hypothetical protein